MVFFFAPSIFAIRRFEVLPSPFPRAAAVSSPRGFEHRKVRGRKRSGWGSRAAWRLSRAGQSNRAPGCLPREAGGAQVHPPGRKRPSSGGVLGGSAKPEATQGPLRTQPRAGLDAAEM